MNPPDALREALVEIEHAETVQIARQIARAALAAPVSVADVIGGSWTPQIGQQVRITSTKDWAKDWVDAAGNPLSELWVAGVQFEPRGWLDVTLSEQWPPKSKGDLADGFIVGHPAQSDDIAPVAALRSQVVGS